MMEMLPFTFSGLKEKIKEYLADEESARMLSTKGIALLSGLYCLKQEPAVKTAKATDKYKNTFFFTSIFKRTIILCI